MKVQNFFLGIFFVLVFALVFFVPSINSLMLGVFSQSFNSSQQSILTNTLNETDNIHLEINATSERELVLDGSGDYVSVGSSSSYDLSENFTISLWVKDLEVTNSSVFNGVFSKGGDSSGYRLLDYDNRSLIQLTFGTDTAPTHGVYLSPTRSILENWVLLSITYNKTFIQAYYNGVPYGNPISQNGSLKINTNSLLIGSAQSTFNGSIDEVQIFNRALSSAEIANIYFTNRTTYNGSREGLVGEWTFDNFKNNFLDSSKNNNNGAAADNATTHVDNNYPQNSPYANLIGYWNFDSDRANASNASASKKAYDLSNLNNDGLYVGNAYSSNVSGIYDDALVLDGNGDYVSVPFNSAYNSYSTTNQFSVSFWYNTQKNWGDYSRIVGRLYHASGWAVNTFSNSFYISLNNDSNVGKGFSTYRAPIINDTWMMATFVCFRPTPTEYNCSTYSNTTLLGSQKINVGGFSGNSNGQFFLEGYATYSPIKLDEVMIFDKALTQQEISNMYNNQSKRFKDSGTIEGKQSTINSGYDLLELNLSKENNFNTNVQSRVGQWNKDLGYNVSMEGLVGYYSLDNSSWIDLVGNNNGTTSGNITMGEGVYNNSAVFNGASSITIPTKTLVAANASESFGAWFKTNSLSSNSQFIIDEGRDENALLIQGTSNKLFASLSCGSSIGGEFVLNSNSAVANNTWYHAMVTFDQSRAYFYVNGVLTNSTAWNCHNNFNSGINIGRRGDSTGTFFNGSIDEVMIFNRSLSASEIKELYIKGIANWNYTDYQTVSGNSASIPITTSTTNVYPQIKLNADSSYSFYSPFVFTTSNSTVTGLDEINPPIANVSLQINETYTNNQTLNFTINLSDQDTGIKNATLNMTSLNNSWLVLDGNGDYVRVGNNSILNPTTDATFLAWVKPSSFGTEQYIFGKRSSDVDTTGYGIYYVSKLYSRFGNGTALPRSSSSSTASNGQWILTTVVYNPQGIYFYENGQLVGSSLGDSGAILSNTLSLSIGSRGSTYYFNGSIDEVRVYNRSLSPSEITAIYNSGMLSNPNLNSTGLVGWYDFEGSSTIVIDKSGNGNNGTNQGDAKITNSQEQTQNFAANTTSAKVGFVQSITEGIWNWFWKIFDWSDNQVLTETYETTIDRTNASIEFLSPTPEEGEFKSSATINMTASDQDNVSLFLDWNNSLVGWWTFDSISGSTVTDSSGRGNSGTKYGDARVDVNGRMGDAMVFDGNGDYVDVTNSNSLNMGNNSFSTSAWIKTNSNGRILGKNWITGSENGVGYSISIETSVLKFNIRTDNLTTYIASGTTNLTDGNWHNVFSVRNANTNKLEVYVDGINESSANIALGSVDNTQFFTIGRLAGSGIYFNGSIDDVMIFNRALSMGEIQAIYSNSSTKYLEKTFENLVSGQEYSFKAYAQDRAGNINFTETRTIIGGTFPQFNNLTINNSNNETIDPNQQINITVNVTNIGINVEKVILQWHNTTQDWNNIPSTQNLTMDNIGDIYNATLTLPEYQDNITYRFWANNTEHLINVSTNYTLYSYWDCSWNISTNDLETAAGFNEDLSIGNVTVFNTGDTNYTNGCNVKYTFDYSAQAGSFYPDFSIDYLVAATSTSDLSSTQGFKANSSTLPKSITLSAGQNRTVEVSAGFPYSAEVLDETPSFNITSNLSDSVDGTSAEVVSARIVVTPGAYLDTGIESPSTSFYRINLTNQSSEFSAFVRDLVSGTNDNVAFNVSLNWTIPTAIQTFFLGNNSYFNETLNDTEKRFLNLTMNLTETVLESANIGENEFTLYIYSYGYKNSSGNLSLINHSSGNIIEDSIILNFDCYLIADRISIPSCGSRDGDYVAPTVSSGSSGGSGGGGGASGDSFEKSEAQFELLRGADQVFQLPIENKLDSPKRNISIRVSGTNSEYVSFEPQIIDEIKGKSSKNLTIKITAPSYFSQGKYLLKFDLEGMIAGNTSKKFTETKFVTLYIVELTRQTADKYLSDSERMIKEMKESNFYLTDVENYYTLMQSSYNEVNFLAVEDNYKLLKSVYDAAFGSEKLIEELYSGLDWAQKRGIETIETKKLLYVAETVFKRGDYLLAYKNLKDAQLTYALETKGEFNLIYEIQQNPTETAGILIAVLLLSFGATVTTKLSVYKKKLKMFDQEEKLLLELMKVIQAETFEKNKMSMEEYRESMNQYESKLAKTINEKIMIQARIANLMKVSGKRKALAQEKERLIDLMREVQNKYLKMGEMETRVYENMFKIYNTRLAKVEEELLFMEAKQFIRGSKVPKGKKLGEVKKR